MTCHPIPENQHCWWLVCGKERRLHAVAGQRISPGQMRDAIDEARLIPARAVCGLRRRWWMPGLFSRLGRRRCVPCCRALVIEPGYGTPANENDLKQKDQAA
ncbi:hypothetical protein [Streptomyces sp. NBC_00996]|uniref:hypothetical protein n=1 Tax=Streptomyces sp. NBC_00996 TaxID=2903710 RepID=UPI003869215F|nr:hypothetical protein OG390_17355 [Streptomyces sp. NBC_00996]